MLAPASASRYEPYRQFFTRNKKINSQRRPASTSRMLAPAGEQVNKRKKLSGVTHPPPAQQIFSMPCCWHFWKKNFRAISRLRDRSPSGDRVCLRRCLRGALARCSWAYWARIRACSSGVKGGIMPLRQSPK